MATTNTSVADRLKSIGSSINTATTLSADTKKSLADKQAKAKAWLSVTKNQRILLYTLVAIMVIVNFSVFWALDMEKIKADDKDELAKLGHLSNISIVTLLFVLGLGFFEIMAYMEKPVATVAPAV